MLRWLIRFLWELQPRSLRRLELRILQKILLRPVHSERRIIPGDIVVCGFLGTLSGLGQSARQILRQLQALGFDAKPSNFSRFSALDDLDGGPLWPADALPGGVVIICVNPDVFHLAFAALKRHRITNRRIIGMWHWELQVYPPEWARAVDCVDEIWVGSHFTADGLRKIAGKKPIRVVPPPIDVKAIPMKPHRDPLPDFKDRLIVFFMYDARSVHARKYPEAVIEAFRRATADDPKPVLIIKVNNGSTWPETYTCLERAAAGMPNVHIISEQLNNESMQDLLARIDIVLSLHRSEGFGLLMAEAMAAAKPVIATGWSGNLDFMTSDCSVLIDCTLVPAQDPQHIYDKPGAVWAEPDIDQAAKVLRRLLDDPTERQRLGQAARAHITTYLSKDKWLSNLGDSFANVLINPGSDSLAGKPAVQESQNRPKMIKM